jgi:hypothetical protein
MKKISSIKQLDAEKKRMGQHREALEEKISDNWNDLKVNMKPANLAKDAFRQAISEKTAEIFNHKTVVKGLVSFGAALLVKRMLQKRVGRLFKRR